MVTIVDLITMYKNMTPAEWTAMYGNKDNAQVEAWNDQYGSTNAAVEEYNQMCEATRLGQLDSLTEAQRELIEEWNSQG